MSREKTFWNGEACKARTVRVIVGKAPKGWWCADLEGQERVAVEIIYGGQKPFYLDNEDGSGWEKVTIGRDTPRWGHSSLPVERVIEDQP